MSTERVDTTDRSAGAGRAGLLRRAVAMERGSWVNLAQWVTRRPVVPEGADGFPYAGAMNPVLIAFIAVSAIEIPVAHLLIPWAWLRIIVLIIGIWGLLWMVGLLATVQRHPHLVEPGGLRIRNANRVELAIPWDAVASVSGRLRSLDSGKTLQQQETRGGTAVIVAVTSQTNVELRLSRPVIFELPTGPVEAVEVRCYADDPAALAATIRSKIIQDPIVPSRTTALGSGFHESGPDRESAAGGPRRPTPRRTAGTPRRP